MKFHTLIFFVFEMSILYSLNNIAYGQAENNGQKIPTYKQIKPAKDEIIDYQKDGLIINKPNLFNYPKNSVIYILNGKSTEDYKYVKELLSKKEIEIENILIEKPNKKGKRIIIINYNILDVEN